MFSPFGFMGTQAGGGLDPDATAYIDKVIAQGGSLSAGDETAIQTLYTDLKSNSLYGEMVYMYPFMGGTPDSHKVEGLAPNDANTLLTWVDSISQSLAHTSMGVDKTVANSNGYGFPTTNLDTFHSDVNDVSIGGYVSTAQTNDLGFLIAHIANQTNETRYQLNSPYDSNIVYVGFGRNNALATYNNGSAPVGIWIGSRTSDISQVLYKNGSAVNTNTTLNSGAFLPTTYLELFSMGGGSGITPITNGFDGVCGFIFGGNGLTAGQVSTLNGILSTFLTSIGRL